MFLLDTNDVSELRKLTAGRADPAVVAWNAQALQVASFLSVISLLELEIGVGRVERRDAAHGAVLRRWLDKHVIPGFEDRILPVDAPVSRRCAALHVPDRRPEYDALIAATAAVHGLTVVTRNVADFAAMGVPLLNPWEYAA